MNVNQCKLAKCLYTSTWKLFWFTCSDLPLLYQHILTEVPYNVNYILVFKLIYLSAKLQKLACEQLLWLWCTHTASICKHFRTSRLYVKGCIQWISSPAFHKLLSMFPVIACLFTSCPKWIEFKWSVSPRNQVIYQLLLSQVGWTLCALKSSYLLDKTGKTNQQFAKIVSVSGFPMWAHVVFSQAQLLANNHTCISWYLWVLMKVWL